MMQTTGFVTEHVPCLSVALRGLAQPADDGSHLCAGRFGLRLGAGLFLEPPQAWMDERR